MDWEECKNKKTVKSVASDENMVGSLTKSSNNKLESEKQLPLNKTTVASKLSLAYDSLRELLEALALKNGYKIYNHECYTSFLKEIMRQSNEGDEFDEIRKIRNAVNYYGKEIPIGEAKDIIGRIYRLRNFVQEMLGK